MTDKTVTLALTHSDLDRAQGGQPQVEDDRPLRVRVPAEYDPAAITAEDVILDEAIVVVGD